MLIKDKNVATHRAFEVQLFTQTSFAANVRNVLSSYSFRSNGAKVNFTFVYPLIIPKPVRFIRDSQTATRTALASKEPAHAYPCLTPQRTTPTHVDTALSNRALGLKAFIPVSIATCRS